MGFNCALLVADSFCFVVRGTSRCLFSNSNQVDVMKCSALRNSRYLDGIISISKSYFEQTVSQIYLTDLQLNKVVPVIQKHPIWILFFP